MENACQLVSQVPCKFITSIRQHPKSSEVLHDISDGHLRSKTAAFAVKTPPNEAETPPVIRSEFWVGDPIIKNTVRKPVRASTNLVEGVPSVR